MPSLALDEDINATPSSSGNNGSGPPSCAGCHLQLEQTDSSICVSFGDALWHVECFRCHKCSNQIQPDSTVLLLSSGLPICEDCSYVCSACGLSISNEAIVTGNDSYHAYCFRCKACDTRIDELVFAKTTSGIYCMTCHNERVARTRRHAEHKRNKSLRRTARDKDNDAVAAAPTNGSSNSNSGSSHRHNQQHRNDRERSYRGTDSRDRIASQSHNHSNSLTSTPTSADASIAATPSSATSHGNTPRTNVADRHEASSITTPRKPTPSGNQDAHDFHFGISPSHSSQPPVVLQNAPPPRNLKQMRENSGGNRPGLGLRASSSSGGLHTYTQQQHDRTPSASTSTSPVPQPATSPAPASSTSREVTSPLLSSRFVSQRTSPSSQYRSPSPAIVLGDSDAESVATDTDLTSRHFRDASASSREASSRYASANSGHSETLRNDLSSSSARPNEHLGLSVPQPSTKSANRRSGFYGVANLPPASPPIEGGFSNAEKAGLTGSAPLRPSSPLSRPLEVGDEERNGGSDDYFSDQPASRSSPSAPAVSSTAESSSVEKALPETAPSTLPVVIEKSLTAMTTPQTSPPPASTTSPLKNRHTSPRPPRTSSAAHAASVQQPSPGDRSQDTTAHPVLRPPFLPTLSSPTRGSLSLNDTDILVFLDAVNDSTALKRSSTSLGMSKTATNGRSDVEDGAHSSDSIDEAEGQRPPRTSRRPVSSSKQVDPVPSPSPGRNANTSGARTPSTKSPSRMTSPSSESRTKLRNKSSLTFTDAAMSPRSSLNGKRKGRASGEGQPGLQPAANADAADLKSTENVRKLRESIRRSRGGSVSTASRNNGMTLDVELVESLLLELEQTKNKMKDLQKNYNAIRRASRQAFEGFSMAREEYDREVQSRRDAEFEMLQLRDQLKQQAAALGNLDAIHKQQELLQTKTETLRNSYIGMERELSKIKAERDIAVAEIEELASVSKTQETPSDIPKRVSGMLTARLSAVRDDYRKDLENMALERDALKQELDDLRQAKDIFIAETDSLNKRNAELANERDAIARSLETAKAELAQTRHQLGTHAAESSASGSRHKELPLHVPHDRSRAQPSPNPFPTDHRQATNLASSQQASSAINTAILQKQSLPLTPHTAADDSITTAVRAEKSVITAVPQIVAARKFKWGSKKGTDKPSISTIHKVVPHLANMSLSESISSGRQHSFQATSILRPVRCEHCGDKMWGMGELRCHACGVYCHTKCQPNYHHTCAPGGNHSAPMSQLSEPVEMVAMSMFGNDLVAQCLTEERSVPRIVTKCIEAVELASMDYEGIYRKSGGMGQTKAITAHFDRGDAFNLQDEDKFNDISAVTSVLKNYFRQLPNPLFTFECHEDFCALPMIKDSAHRNNELAALLASLPDQHFDTLRTLMMHLHRIHLQSAANKMTPANLGVVFGPTLLRSPDPSQEFSQLNLKARIVEITVENAPHLFAAAHRLDT